MRWLAGEFEPGKYRDTYRADVLALIERKAEGKEIAVQPEADQTPEPAPDLMSALKASLDAVRERTAEAPSKKRKAPAKKAAAKASAAKASAKKPPAKKAAGKRATAKR